MQIMHAWEPDSYVHDINENVEVGSEAEDLKICSERGIPGFGYCFVKAWRRLNTYWNTDAGKNGPVK